MAVLRGRVEPEVRRPDDDDRVRADLRGMRGKGHGLRGRLGAAVDGHLEPAVGRLEEEVGDEPPLLLREQDPLPRRPERHEAVEPGADEEVDERAERSVVDVASGSPERRYRRRKRSAKRHQRCGRPARTRSTVPAIRRARVSGRFASSIHSTYSRRWV